MKIEIIPCLNDNYSYLIHDEISNTVAFVDPSEFIPCDTIISKNYKKLDFIPFRRVNKEGARKPSIMIRILIAAPPPPNSDLIADGARNMPKTKKASENGMEESSRRET